MDYAVNRFYSAAQGRFTQVDPIGMRAVSLSDPQSLNLYSYVQNDPVNFVDPTGRDIIPVTSCVTQKVNGEIIGIDCEIVYYITGGGPVALPFSGIGDGSGGIGGGGGGTQSNEIKKDCEVTTTFDQLSPAQQALFSGGANEYNALSSRQKAAFLTITARLSAANVSFTGLKITDVRNDKINFAYDFVAVKAFDASIKASGNFEPSKPLTSQHPGYSDYGHRQKGVRNSVQAAFGQRGVQVDIDPANPNSGLAGLIMHGFDFAFRETDIFKVARSLEKQGLNTKITCK
jgi:RHS repeat-associated protein